MSLKISQFILLCLLANATLFAQTTGSLQGKAIDVGNEEPMIGAVVVLLKDTTFIQETFTNVDGGYNFKLIPAGKYNVEVRYLGYPDIRIVDIIITGDTTNLDIEMNESGDVIHAIELACVSLHRIQPKQIQRITRNDIKNIPARDISSVLSTVPGVVSADQGESSSASGSRITSGVILVDGSPVSGTSDILVQEALQEKPSSKVPESTTEEYSSFAENEYKSVKEEKLSTFSIDVDKASYSNIRRFINQSERPPKDAVRIEEMINYFNYNYNQPTDEHPFTVSTEVSDCPWNKEAKLMKIGLQGKTIDLEKAPANNLVFLIDVSGSMNVLNKLPLVKESLKVLINNMRKQDKMALVVYAGAAGLIQASTNNKGKLLAALKRLNAGGSTAGGEGILLAYKIAKENFVENGNNRVILATDGDFNVGDSDEKSLEKLIVEKREEGVFLTVLGFGMGNYKDNKMEILADKGNGNYAYIDNLSEAEKTLGKEMGGTLYVIAKDVKLQLEFDSTQVQSYRLVGYENRLLNNEDFANDKKDAGELGSGHTVTALYEIILQKDANTNSSENLMIVNLRYKQPKDSTSILMVHPQKRVLVSLEEASENFRFAAAVAGFGMLLRDSKYKHDWTYTKVLELAKASKGEDKEGYRQEFIGLVRNVNSMTLHAKK